MSPQLEARTWPGAPYSEDAKDLTAPLRAVLRELHVLEDSSKKRTPLSTPFSWEVITAGATTFSRNWSLIIGALGGVGAVTSALKAAGYGSSEPVLAATFTASAAVLLAATVLAVALMVTADVKARGEASAAQYAARATIASAMMASSRYGRPVPEPAPAPAPPPSAPHYLVQVKDKWYPVERFRQSSTGVVVDLVGQDDVVRVADVAGITTSDAWGAG